MDVQGKSLGLEIPTAGAAARNALMRVPLILNRESERKTRDTGYHSRDGRAMCVGFR